MSEIDFKPWSMSIYCEIFNNTAECEYLTSINYTEVIIDNISIISYHNILAYIH